MSAAWGGAATAGGAGGASAWADEVEDATNGTCGIVVVQRFQRTGDSRALGAGNCRNSHRASQSAGDSSVIQANDPLLSGAAKEESFPALGSEFPSLGAAKEKKKKKQTMSLADFQSTGSGGRSSSFGRLPSGPSSRVDMMSLPTGPRARVEGEEGDDVGMGGAFRGYGGDRDGGRGRYGDRDDERRERREDMMQPSRADEASDWGAERKFVPSDGGRRGGFGGGGGYREGGYGGRDGGYGGRDGGYGGRDGGYGSRDGLDRMDRPPSRADTEDRWGRAPLPAGREDRRGGFGDRMDRDRGDRGFAPRESRADTEDRWGRAPGPVAGGDDGRERPRLKLKPRTKPVEEVGADAPKGDKAIFGEAKPVDQVAKEVEDKLKVESDEKAEEQT